MKIAKWLTGGLGWAFGGPIGGLLGFMLGALIDEAAVDDTPRIDGKKGGQQQRTRQGDFGVSLVILTAAMMRADGKVLKAELDYVKSFFVRSFGDDKAQELILLLREMLKQDFNLREVCMQIRMYMNYAERLQLVHFLSGLAAADGDVNANETDTLNKIRYYLGVNQNDYHSVKATYKQSIESDYEVLEITATATDDEVKKAYRRMAIKYHPDKVAHLGDDVQKGAKEKFQRLTQAYENVKKYRGIS
ncbi:MAG: TerB family tellurite resistance protein [Sphingobacteriales bacterium JAD_PAG50586_3]|nr:MAG: TerB family tellurite resistance protein [Sphingobacteriales bacterium JAD_PAG50586_3]